MPVSERTGAPVGEVIELVAFEMSGQSFAVRTMLVREIRGWAPCMRLPQTRPEILGVMNLRGAVIPIIDLSLRLGIGATEATARSAVVVVEVRDTVVGLLVEQVSDMLSVNVADIQPVPTTGGDDVAQFAEGIVTLGKSMICFLNLDEVIDRDAERSEAA